MSSATELPAQSPSSLSFQGGLRRPPGLPFPPQVQLPVDHQQWLLQLLQRGMEYEKVSSKVPLQHTASPVVSQPSATVTSADLGEKVKSRKESRLPVSTVSRDVESDQSESCHDDDSLSSLSGSGIQTEIKESISDEKREVLFKWSFDFLRKLDDDGECFVHTSEPKRRRRSMMMCRHMQRSRADYVSRWASRKVIQLCV